MTVFWNIAMPVRVLLTIGLLCAAGCGGGDSVTNESPGQTASPEEVLIPSAAAAVSLAVLNASETDELIASHEGQIVVVDLWALW